MTHGYGPWVANEEKFEFAMDLDYIFKWVHPGPGETYFKFWVAPVTMVFENAYDIARTSVSIDLLDLTAPPLDQSFNALSQAAFSRGYSVDQIKHASRT